MMASSLAGLLLLYSVFATVHAGIEYGPTNVAIVDGEPVILRCLTDGVPSTNVRWYEYVTKDWAVMISDGVDLVPGHPNRDRYTLITNDSLTFDLQISPTELGDAGFYECEDSNAVPPSIIRLGAQVVILESDPVCESTVPTDGIVLEGDYYTSECEVKFRADPGIAPLLSWRGAGNYDEAYTSTNTTAWSGTSFNVDRSINAQNFQCKTNFTSAGFVGPDRDFNPPSYTHYYQGNQMFVRWPPMNLYATPVQGSYEVGQIITCYSDANPTATYMWQSLRTSEIWNSQSFTTTLAMVGYQLMRCQAMNEILGDTYTKDYYLDVYVNAPTTTASTTAPSTTTPPPPVANCPDLTGRWEAINPNGSLCLTVDHDNDARLIGLFMNGSDTYWLQLTGRTREGQYDESGFSVIWPSTSIGVSSVAAECYSCFGEDTMYADAISRTSKGSEFCASGGNVTRSPMYKFYRVPTSWPCSSSVAIMQQNIDIVTADIV